MALRPALTAFTRDERGATVIEYALIVSLIFLAILAAVTLFAQNGVAKFDYASDTIADATN